LAYSRRFGTCPPERRATFRRRSALHVPSRRNRGERYREDIKDQLGFTLEVNRPRNRRADTIQPVVSKPKAEWRPVTPKHREGGHQ
jgi:hypothetical protein